MKNLFFVLLVCVATMFAKDIKTNSEGVTVLGEISVVGSDGKKRALPPDAKLTDFGDGVQVLEVITSVEFDTNKYNIRKDYKPILKELAKFLKERPEFFIQLIGRADHRGPAEYNKRLAHKRAMTIKKYLMKIGVKSKDIEIVKGGEHDVLADNSTPAGMEVNRSVEIRMVKREQKDLYKKKTLNQY